MFGVIMPLCNRMFCCIFGWYFYIEIRLKFERNILLSTSRAFSLSTPTFSLSIPVDNSEATWKKATKCNKHCDVDNCGWVHCTRAKDLICMYLPNWIIYVLFFQCRPDILIGHMYFLDSLDFVDKVKIF